MSFSKDHGGSRDFEYKEFLNKYRKYFADKSAHYYSLLSDLIDFMKPNPGKRLLSVGCGFGFYELELANLGMVCICLDIIRGKLRILKLGSKLLERNAKAICGDGTSIPFRDESFEAVMSIQFFTHVRNLDAALYEQVRVLKRGGLFFMEDANLLSLRRLFDLLFLCYIRTNGKHGGAKWLLMKNKLQRNLYGFNRYTGKDEDAKSIVYWIKKMRTVKELNVLKIATPMGYRLKCESSLTLSALTSVLSRGIRIFAQKKSF